MIEQRIQLNDEAAAILRNLETMPAWMVKHIRADMDKQNQLTVARIQQLYLSFPKDGPIVQIGCRAISNRLRGSIFASPATVSGQRVESAIGSNVVYAAAQEFGFDGEETVRPHMRKQFKEETVFGRRRNIQKADIGVRSFTRHMHLRERGFIRRGISDRAQNYTDAISAGITDGFNKNESN